MHGIVRVHWVAGSFHYLDNAAGSLRRSDDSKERMELRMRFSWES